jgi:putative transposase
MGLIFYAFGQSRRGGVYPRPQGSTMDNFPVRKRIRLALDVYKQRNAFSVTIRTHEGYPWFLLHDELPKRCIRLFSSVPDSVARLYAWCVMPNHVHLLLDAGDLIGFVRIFKGKMSREAYAIERNRKLWQRSFYDHALRREESLQQVGMYIWNNPVRKGIVNDARHYEWSGSTVWPHWREFFGRG